MQRERRTQQIPSGEPDVADEERKMDIGNYTVPGDPESIDSQLVITLYKDEREPHLLCTKAGRMTGQMVMGLEGAGMMKIDNVLRAAQLALRREAGHVPKSNLRPMEDRLMQTKENSGG